MITRCVQKKFRLTIFMLLECLCIVNPAASQDKDFRELFREAEYFVITEDYSQAIRIYKDLINQDDQNSNLHFLIGYCMLNSNHPVTEAINHLNLAAENIDKNYSEGSHFEKSAPPLALFLLGKAYLRDYQFNMAEETFREYKSMIDYWAFAEIEYVNRYIKSCEIARELMKNPLKATFTEQHFSGDTSISQCNPVVSGNDSVMIFRVSNKKVDNIGMIYRIDSMNWSKPEYIKEQLGLKEQIFPVSISYQGDELYLVAKDDFKSDIYVSHYASNKWQPAEEMGSPVNSKFLETHASVSKDGQVLYFTSNRKGGWGGLDIYRCTRNKKGKWKDAENLGFGINTYYNEETPFIAENDSALYFSSEGHETMGGYDVFVTQIDHEGNFTAIRNIGFPISTPEDDLFFNPSWNSDKDYISRAVKNHPTDQEIYSVAYTLPPEIPSEQIAESMIDSVINDSLQLSENHTLENNNDSLITSDLLQNNSFEKETSKSIDKDKFNGPSASTNQGRQVERNPLTPLKKYYILNNILFEFNSSILSESALDEVNHIAAMMNMYEDIDIELVGNADSVGSFEYNYELAKRRVFTVRDYLTGKGILETRINIAVHGEAFPVAKNTYKDGADAWAGRALNRSVEVRINNEGAPNVHVAEIFVPSDLVPEHDKIYSIFIAESDNLIDTIPEKIEGLPIALIYTKNTKVYTAGSFNSKLEAISFLDKFLDYGYEDAGIIERRKFESTLRTKSQVSRYESPNYTIQILALSTPTENPDITSIETLSIHKGSDGLYRYAVGKYKTVNEARKNLEILRSQGFKGAFIRPLIYYQASSAE